MSHKLYEIDELIESIKQIRDEVNLQMHLAKAELREEWDKTEEEYERIKSKASAIQNEVSETSRDVIVATKKLGDEVKNGYDRIRKQL